jgi:hypothetical protein
MRKTVRILLRKIGKQRSKKKSVMDGGVTLIEYHENINSNEETTILGSLIFIISASYGLKDIISLEHMFSTLCPIITTKMYVFVDND